MYARASRIWGESEIVGGGSEIESRCNTLRHTAIYCDTLQVLLTLSMKANLLGNTTGSAFVVCCSVLQCVAVCCSVLQCVAVCCSMLQCSAVCYSVLQCVAV